MTIFQYGNVNLSCNVFKNTADKSKCQAYEQAKRTFVKEGIPNGFLQSE